MKKKILSLLLALSILCSMTISVSAAEMVNRTPETPTYTVPARTAEDVQVRLAELIAKYKGTYWTSTGQPCSSHKEYCYSKYYNAWQCNGFARYIFNELFCSGDIGSYEGSELYYLPSPRNAAEVGRVTNLEATDTATVKAILGQAQPGDFFQVRNRETGRPHSMIITEVTTKGLWILDCNSDGKCGVTYYLHTWDVIAARYDSFSLYHSTKYPAPANPFTDVADSDWYFNAVMWAKDAGVTGGKTASSFAPNEGCTRAQVVTFLWAAAGKPEPKSSYNPFTDVRRSDWFYKPVLWARENGITSGISPTVFGTDAPCTRAQVATFLWAAMGKPAANGSSPFIDVADSDWYGTPITWASEKGIAGGIGNGMFGANNTCTRAQVVTFLYNTYSY